MAVAFSRWAAGTASASSATADVDLSACSVGDLALLQVSRVSTVGPSGVPAGWNLVRSVTSLYQYWLYAKVLEAGDIGTVTFTWGAPSKTMANCAVYTGHDTTTPVADSTVWSDGALGTPVGAPSITSGEPMLVFFTYFTSTSSRTVNDLAGTVERYDVDDLNPDFGQSCRDTNGTWGGGTINPTITATLSVSGRASFSLAIAAAAGAAAPGYFIGSKLW